MLFDKLAKVSIALLGFDLFCLNKKFLVINLVDRNLKIKYRRSYLGFFWTVFSPLVMSLTYYFVFKMVLKIEREYYFAFMICAVMPWNFFVQSVIESTESIVSNAGLLTKIPIPVHVFPYVTAITNFATLVFSIPVIFASAFISGAPVGFTSIFMLYFFCALMLITYALGASLSILFVYLRDLRHAIGLLMQLWFYATPVLYDATMIPAKFKWLLYVNPLGCIFEGIHESFLGSHAPDPSLFIGSAIWVIASYMLLKVVYLFLKPGLIERI